MRCLVSMEHNGKDAKVHGSRGVILTWNWPVWRKRPESRNLEIAPERPGQIGSRSRHQRASAATSEYYAKFWHDDLDQCSMQLVTYSLALILY